MVSECKGQPSACGGMAESLGEISEYCFIESFADLDSDYTLTTKTIAPEAIIEWINELIYAIIFTQGYDVEKPLQFLFIIGKVKVDRYEKGTAGMYLHDHHQIVIIISKAMYSYLKKANPKKRMSRSFSAIIEIVWHELYHACPNVGREFPNDDDYDNIIELFLEFLDGVQEEDDDERKR